jgi:hypothetical protein
MNFPQVPNVDLAFASNLLGTAIGFRKLWLIALALYALSYVVLFLPARKTAVASA